MQRGGSYSPGGGTGPIDPHNGNIGVEQAYRESLRDMNGLRDFIRQHPEYANDMLQLMHALNPAYTNDGLLSDRISREVLPQLEKLELELRRKLDESNADQVRSAGSEKMPAGYADAIADYFRKLSKGK